MNTIQIRKHYADARIALSAAERWLDRGSPDMAATFADTAYIEIGGAQDAGSRAATVNQWDGRVSAVNRGIQIWRGMR